MIYDARRAPTRPRSGRRGQGQPFLLAFINIQFFVSQTHVISVEKTPGFAGGLAEFDSSVVILLVLVLDWNHCIQQKHKAMDIDDDRSCLPVGFEYEYRFAEYEYDILSPAPLRSLPQATRYAGGT